MSSTELALFLHAKPDAETGGKRMQLLHRVAAGTVGG